MSAGVQGNLLHALWLWSTIHYHCRCSAQADSFVLCMVLKGEIVVRGEMFSAIGLSLASRNYYRYPVYVDKGFFALGVRLCLYIFTVFAFHMQ